MFKENWLNLVEELIERRNRSSHVILDNTEFKNKISLLCNEVANQTASNIKNGQPPEKAIAHINLLASKSSLGITDLIRSYNSIYLQNEKLINVRKQEVAADYHERIRYLVFRILTAIGIGAVVLTVGWVAQKLNVRRKKEIRNREL